MSLKEKYYLGLIIFLTVTFVVFFAFKIVPNVVFGEKLLFYLFGLLVAAIAPDWYFLTSNKDLERKIIAGEECNSCRCKMDNECIGFVIIDKNKHQIECQRLDKFGKQLGIVERIFYFIILIVVGFDMNFLKIIFAWLTLKTVGDYWSIKDENTSNISTHFKRAKFVLFLLNNLISVGIVMLIFFITKWSLGCFNSCFFWCFN